MFINKIRLYAGKFSTLTNICVAIYIYIIESAKTRYSLLFFNDQMSYTLIIMVYVMLWSKNFNYMINI